MAAVLMHTSSALAPLWKSLARQLKGLSFSDTISAACADVARRIVLSQLHNLDHGTLVIFDVDGSKHHFGVSATTSVINGDFEGIARPLEKGQLHRKRALTIELHIHSPSA